MTRHKRSTKGILLRQANRELMIPFITPDDLLSHVSQDVLPGLFNDWFEALDRGYEIERARRLNMLRNFYLPHCSLTGEQECSDYILTRAKQDEVDLTFISNVPRTRGRPRHPETVVDLELLDEIEAARAEQGLRSVKQALGYLAGKHPEFLGRFVAPYDRGLTSRAKQIAALEVRLSHLKSRLRAAGPLATGRTVLSRLIQREIVQDRKGDDLRYRLAEAYLVELRKKLLS